MDTTKPLFLDIMLNGKYICQMKYTGRPTVEFVSGELMPVYDFDDLYRFVDSQRPSLKGKKYSICPTNQRI